jgi:hypothetical protein
MDQMCCEGVNMRIHFHGPFESLAEKETRIDLDRPVSVGELLGLICRRYEAMSRYAGIRDDADLSAHLVFLRDGQFLRLSDWVQDGDLIRILLPATGG